MLHCPNPSQSIPLCPRAVIDTLVLDDLRQEGIVSEHRIANARREARDLGVSAADLLSFYGEVDEDIVGQRTACLMGLKWLSAGECAPCRETLTVHGAQNCLNLQALPLARKSGKPAWAVADANRISELIDQFGLDVQRTEFYLAAPAVIEAVIEAEAADLLAGAALTQLSADQSCRRFGGYSPHRVMSVGGLTLIAVFSAAPVVIFVMLFVLAAAAILLNTALKAVAVAASFRHKKKLPPPVAPSERPVVSILVPLFREGRILPALVRRLGALDYPLPLLDICLVLEAGDTETRQALARLDLPANIRCIIVPDGPIKTKPRAMNYALHFCRGSIIGIYDAEDAPEPDQISKAVAALAAGGDRLACVQAALGFYNHGSNWMARCFAIEYATWFRVMLPGLSRLGIPLPLGGTSLFIRREVLMRVGGWDAHNVTEDADLGVRLARHGYRTEMIESITWEEANCRAWPWVRQRSRWLKGYMLTYRVFMQQPLRLIREIGLTGFCGLQVLFLGTLTGFLLAPLLWSFWLASFAVGHPVIEVLPQGTGMALTVLFLLAEGVNITAGLIAVARAGQTRLAPWVPGLHPYFYLATAAVYKALYEALTMPFYWDKTSHGHLSD